MTTPFDDSSAQILVGTDVVKRRRNEKRVSRFKVSLFAAMLVVAIVATASAVFFGAQYASVNARVAELEASANTSSQQAGDAQARIEELEAAVAEKDQKLASQEELLTSREGFLTALDEAAALIAEAKPKVSVAEFYSTVSAEQEKVLAERSNPSVVTNATAAVRDAMNTLRAQVQEYDEEQQRIEEEKSRQNINPDEEPPAADTASSDGAGSSSGDAILANVRAALNEVGGGAVRLEHADIVCDMATAIACAHSDGHISVANRVVRNSKNYWMGPMAHEYAHQIQFSIYGALMASSTQASLFGTGDPGLENLADCMAKVRVPSWRGPYLPDCSGDQLAFAARVWNGSAE